MSDEKPQIVRVLLFGALRERAGIDAATLRLDPGESVSVGALLERLAAAHPAIRPALPVARVAVNQEYAPRERMVRTGDEVALITPVSGG